MVECKLNDTRLEDSNSRKALRRVRLLYLVFLVIWLLGTVSIIALRVETREWKETMWSLSIMCYPVFLAFCAVATRYALDYSWTRVAVLLAAASCVPVATLVLVVFLDRRVYVPCIPIAALVLVVLLDHPVYVAGKKTCSLPASGVRLAESRRGASHVLLPIDLAGLFLLSAAIPATRYSFKTVLEEMVEGQLAWITVFFLGAPIYIFCAVFGLMCFALIIKEYTFTNRRWRLRANLVALLLWLSCAVGYAVALFGPMIQVINSLSSTDMGSAY